jgi:hypothetical protein
VPVIDGLFIALAVIPSPKISPTCAEPSGIGIENQQRPHDQVSKVTHVNLSNLGSAYRLS